jgi:hypothetical protein
MIDRGGMALPCVQFLDRLVPRTRAAASKVFISTCTEDLPPCDLRQLVLPHSFCEYFPRAGTSVQLQDVPKDAFSSRGVNDVTFSP